MIKRKVMQSENLISKDQRQTKSNRLVQEKSPYLQQHASNPVDWYPWGEEAFEKARKENKPILVSIGYSTCHWCHVMERESFSKPDIAALMNKYLVSIKIDREERPDIDKIYMTAVTSLTGSGGWPLNIFLTPDLQPFYGGTYFPPDERWGQIGWPELVERIGKTWENPEERKKIIDSAKNLTRQLEEYLSGQEATPLRVLVQPSEGILDQSLMENGFRAFQYDYDSKFGGFGGAPKFPMPVNQNFLLRYHLYAKDLSGTSNNAHRALEMVLHTLSSMAKGGIYDQIGGGFHRYSTDERWHVPHFEKMLYDNSQLIVNYLEAYQITKEELFAQVARDSLEYVLRDLTHPEGGFYSAEDADSLPKELLGRVSGTGHEHKSEGAFYIFEKKEILESLGLEAGEIFSAYFGVKSNGNAESDPQGEFKNKNILYVAGTISQTAEKFGRSEKEINRILEEGKKKLFAARSQRPRPDLDDKILVSWNGLMISAMARAFQIFDDPKYLKAAEHAATFIRDKLYESKDRQLYRRWRDGEKKVRAIADDYAFLAQGLIDLYEASFDSTWLEWAIELIEEQNKRFLDAETGEFYMTDRDYDQSLFVRVKEDSDNVEPSAGSVATLNLLRLAQFTDREDFRRSAEKILTLHARQMKEQSRSLSQMLVALSFVLTKPLQIVITGDPQSSHTQALLKEVNARFIPNKILIVLGDSVSQQKFSNLLPYTDNFRPIEDKPTAYVCVNYTCKLPTGNPQVLKEILDGKNPSGDRIIPI